MTTLQELKDIQAKLAAVIAGLEHEPDELEAGPAHTLLDKAAFFACYRDKFGKLKQEQVEPLEFLLTRLWGNFTVPEAAYMLATVQHETADTYLPVKEAYWLSEEWRKNNLRYFPWYGRGYVQLTWERNYVKAGKELGVDLTTDPDKALEQEVAFQVLAKGMRDGWFTSRKLSDYINKRVCDYVGARNIINGTDRAGKVAGYAERFEACLEQAGYSA